VRAAGATAQASHPGERGEHRGPGAGLGDAAPDVARAAAEGLAPPDDALPEPDDAEPLDMQTFNVEHWAPSAHAPEHTVVADWTSACASGGLQPPLQLMSVTQRDALWQTPAPLQSTSEAQVRGAQYGGP
jgi:hypothetical protein